MKIVIVLFLLVSLSVYSHAQYGRTWGFGASYGRSNFWVGSDCQAYYKSLPSYNVGFLHTIYGDKYATQMFFDFAKLGGYNESKSPPIWQLMAMAVPSKFFFKQHLSVGVGAYLGLNLIQNSKDLLQNPVVMNILDLGAATTIAINFNNLKENGFTYTQKGVFLSLISTTTKLLQILLDVVFLPRIR